MIDTAGRQTPDMTGLPRSTGNGKPRIYRMTDGLWVLEFRYNQFRTSVKVMASWQGCIDELHVVLRRLNSSWSRYGI